MKRIIISIMVLILLSSFVSSLSADDPDLIGYWNFDDASGDAVDSKTNSKPKYDLTPNGTMTYQQTAATNTSTFSIENSGGYFNNTDINDSFLSIGIGGFTVGVSFNKFVDTAGVVVGWINKSGEAGFQILASDAQRVFCGHPSLGQVQITDDASDNEDISIICVYNETNTSISMYSKEGASSTPVINGNRSITYPTTAVALMLGNIRTDFTQRFTGRIDEVWILNRSVSPTEALSILSLGITEVELATVKPVITDPSPVDNSHNNTNVTLRVTHSTENNDVSYYLYFGESTPTDETDLVLEDVTRSGDEFRNFTTVVGDGTYFWKWKVRNTTSGLFSANTTERTLIIDTVTPTITLGSNNNFSSDNSTVLNPYLQNLSIDISFFDTFLFQTLINITNSTDQSPFSILNISMGGATTANYTRTIDISSWAIGDYTIKLSAIDSHTSTKIPDYDIMTGLNYFRYTTEEGNIIKIKSNNFNLFTKSTTKLKDRYDFEFNYLFQQDTYKFTIESYNKIDYLENSDYKAHFVIMGNNGRGNWIDFENPNLARKDYIVTKIDDYTYEVEITANGIKSFTFSSLGGLNLEEQHFLLKLGAVIEVWVFDEETGEGLNATATIGSQHADTTAKTNGATLVNVTKETTTITLNASGFGTEIQTLSVSEKFHNLSFNMTAVSAAKLFFRDEKSESLIEGESFSVFLETTGFSQISTETSNPATIRDLPTGLYKLKASSSNYAERQFLDVNISNTTTTNINIYLINNTLGSEKTFNIVSIDGLAPLENVRTVFTKIINGTLTVVAEEDSDFAGQVVLTLDSNTQYTINFSKSGFEDKTINLEPTNSEYIIQMISTTGAYNQSVHEGIRYRFEPSNTVLNNNTKFNFTFTLNSTVWPITGCTLYLRNGSILLGSTASFTSTSCFLSIEQDTGTMTNITSEAVYQIDSTFNFTVTQQYRVVYTYEGDFSLKNFLDDLTDFGMAGFDNFGRMMLALIVIFVITTLAARNIGFTNPEVLIFLVIAQVWFFSSVNWLFLDFAPIPTILGFNLKKYIIAILVSMAGGAFVMKKFTD